MSAETLKSKSKVPKPPERPKCKKHGCLISVGQKTTGKCVLFDHFPKGGAKQVEAYRVALHAYHEALAKLEGFVEVKTGREAE